MEEIGLEPPRLLEPHVQSRAEQRDDAENDEIAIIRLQLGHVGEIHAVDAGDRRRHRKDRRPGGQLARDDPLSLLLEQTGRLEHRSENFAQAPDSRLDASDVIEHVLKIGPHLPVERRKRDMRQLVAYLVHRPNTRWKRISSRRRVNSRPISSLSRKASSVRCSVSSTSSSIASTIGRYPSTIKSRMA